jgi:hypothetical protein
MVGVIFIACFIFLIGFLLGWGMKSDIRGGRDKSRLPEDKIIEEMRIQRANNYVNNPVVNELEKFH